MSANYPEQSLRLVANLLHNARQSMDDDAASPENILALLDGSENGEAVIELIMDQITEYEILVLGLKDHIKSAREREARLSKRIEKLRDCIAFFLNRTNQRKLVKPLYTISLRDTPPSLIIENEAAIPAEYFEIPKSDPVLNKNHLKEDLQNGVVIHGAVLTEPGIGLTIRRK